MEKNLNSFAYHAIFAYKINKSLIFYCYRTVIIGIWNFFQVLFSFI